MKKLKVITAKGWKYTVSTLFEFEGEDSNKLRVLEITLGIAQVLFGILTIAIGLISKGS